MDDKRRKIKFFDLLLPITGNEGQYKAPEEFLAITQEISELPFDKRVHMPKNFGVGMLNYQERDGVHLYTFFKAQTGRLPDILDFEGFEISGNPLDRAKGPIEKTHVGIQVCDGYIQVGVEQNQKGPSSQDIEAYFLSMAAQLLRSKGEERDFLVKLQITPCKEFLEELAEMGRVRLMTIIVDKSELENDHFLSFAARPTEVKKEVVISINAKKNEDIAGVVRQAFERRADGRGILRIEAAGRKAGDKFDTFINTDIAQKKREIKVDVNESTGIVETPSVLRELSYLLLHESSL